MTVLIVTAVFSILVCSDLSLVSNRNTLTLRSMDWNNAMPMAEAGIEEALTQLQVADTTNFGVNGWTARSGNFYKFRNSLVANGFYQVCIEPTVYAVGFGPTIVSTGYVAVPFSVINYSDPSFASGSGSAGTNTFVHRTVMVTTALTQGFDYGVLVKSGVNISGASMMDSFNSQDPNHSTGGSYDPTKSEANVIVGSTQTSDLGGSYQIGNGLIYGYVCYGASSGNPSIQNGIVGDANYVNNPADDGTFEAGHVIDNFNPPIPDVTPPFTTSGASITTGGSYGGTSYTYSFGSGNYSVVGDLSMSGNQNLLVSGKAVVYVGGVFNLSGSSSIYIAPGGSLTLYVAGSAAQISGGTIVNGTGVAANCAIYGLPGCTQVIYSGSADYVGTVYAPEAALNFSGAASVKGAVVGASLNFSGGMNLHYDEALGFGSRVKYAVTSWQEVP